MTLQKKLIKALVVDDSLFMRTLISNILESYDDIIVVGTARDGYDAIEKIHLLNPDVVTLDIDMPRLDGIGTLGYIMSECPTPVIIISGVMYRNSETTMKALDYGAVDFIAKPAGQISLNIRAIEKELIAKIRTVVHVDLKKLPFVLSQKSPDSSIPLPDLSHKAFPLVIIGASTGGPRAISYLIQHLPVAALVGSFLIIQHMPMGFTLPFARRLDNLSLMNVTEAEVGNILTPGSCYVAPAGHHLVLEKQKNDIGIHFDDGPKEHGVRPSMSVTLRSAALLNHPRSICVILTGMGSDGSDGCKKMKETGAVIIVQNEESSVVFGMPGAAIKTGCVDEELPLKDIPNRIADLM
ncbi:MAG: hypothetical protein B6244_09950 [Candidatus Cloacimonetes bacterium 4572_55]|nr:MAG: hypothetical protein B6244_09950 [Candidatus Cloacimonetes bacterium 4572_55]